MSNKCRAKNPSNCRYHGETTFDTSVKEIAKLRKEISKARDYDELEKLKEKLEVSTLNMDTTTKGFRALSEQLKKATKKDTKKEIKTLQERVEKAQARREELRLEEVKLRVSKETVKPASSPKSGSKPRSLQEIAEKLRLKRRRRFIKRIDLLNANQEDLDYGQALNDFSNDDF